MPANSQKKIIKFVTRGSKADEDTQFINQLPTGNPTLGSCIFTFNPLAEKYDWLVVIDDIANIIPHRIEKLNCPKENTILVTTEPSSITRYGRAFAKQFQYLITNQPEEILPHPNALRSQTGNVWFYGKSYNEIISMEVPKKDKIISTVCSSKQQGHTFHKMRFHFTQKLQDVFKEMDRFGKGYRWIERKADAIDRYKFHICIENHIGKHMWTEKLADTFLGYAVPIYCGCPNVYDYFPKDSIIQIDITEPEKAVEIIKKVISTEGEYERRLDAIVEARHRVIEKYNLFAMINEIVEKSPKNSNRKENESIKIYNRRIMRLRYLPDLIRFFIFRITNLVKGL